MASEACPIIAGSTTLALLVFLSAAAYHLLDAIFEREEVPLFVVIVAFATSLTSMVAIVTTLVLAAFRRREREPSDIPVNLEGTRNEENFV